MDVRWEFRQHAAGSQGESCARGWGGHSDTPLELREQKSRSSAMVSKVFESMLEERNNFQLPTLLCKGSRGGVSRGIVISMELVSDSEDSASCRTQRSWKASCRV